MQIYSQLKKIWIPALLFLVVSLLLSIGATARAESEDMWVPSLNDRVPPTTDSEYVATFGNRVQSIASPGLIAPRVWGVHVQNSHVKIKSDSLSNEINLNSSRLLGIFMEKFEDYWSWTVGLDHYSLSSGILSSKSNSQLVLDYEFLMLPLRMKWYWTDPKKRTGQFLTVGMIHSFLQSAKMKSSSSTAIITRNGEIKSQIDISSESRFLNRNVELGAGHSFVMSDHSAFQITLAYELSTMPLTSIEGNDVYLSGWNLGFQFLF